MDFFVDFLGPFSLETKAGKNPPKNPRFSSKLDNQNPLREIAALIKIDTSLAIATSGLRTDLLLQEPPFRKPPFDFPDQSAPQLLSPNEDTGKERNQPFRYIFHISNSVLFFGSGGDFRRHLEVHLGSEGPSVLTIALHPKFLHNELPENTFPTS